MKSSATKWKLLGTALALGTVAAAQAHHSGSVYDMTKMHTFTGTLSKIEWVAPHVLIHMDVKDADGKVTDWVFEGAPPAWFHHRNLKRADIEKGLGQTVKISGAPARSGIPLASLGDVQFPDGTHFNLFYAPPDSKSE